MERIIIHSDMNSCYASIECSLNPSLWGKPVAVGGNTKDRHGIILAKSEEAKKCGVKTGEVIWQAQRKCPDLIILPPRFEIYQKYSRLAGEIYSDYSDRVEPMGMDEAWCDLTGTVSSFEQAEEIVEEIKGRFRNELGITVSVGISFNKIFAKLGSDLAERDSHYIVTPDNFKEKLWHLPASAMMGVGRNTIKKLSSYGINTIGDLARCSPQWLHTVFGVMGEEIWRYANGADTGEVMKKGEQPPVKSIGHGITCKDDLTTCQEVWRVFLSLAQNVEKRLKTEKMKASSVQISVRNNRLNVKQFQCELPIATQSAFEIAECAFELFKKNYNWLYDVRALTVRAINLQAEDTPVQMFLYDDYERHERQIKIDTAVFDLKRRFGEKAVFNCCLMMENKMPGKDNEKAVPFMKNYKQIGG